MPNDMPTSDDPIIFLDIETLPAEKDSPLWERIQDQSPVPSHEDFESYFEELRPKTALFPSLGRVWMIGFAFKNQEPTTICGDGSLEGERKVLEEFHTHVEKWRDPWWVGHNVSGFDLPFLQVRSLHHNLPNLGRSLGRLRAKPWEKRMLDTQLLWPATGADRYSGSHGIRGTRRLDTVCSLLDIEIQKGDLGPDVYNAFLAGDAESVKEHLYYDVVQVREVFKRIWPLL